MGWWKAEKGTKSATDEGVTWVNHYRRESMLKTEASKSVDTRYDYHAQCTRDQTDIMGIQEMRAFPVRLINPKLGHATWWIGGGFESILYTSRHRRGMCVCVAVHRW